VPYESDVVIFTATKMYDDAIMFFPTPPYAELTVDVEHVFSVEVIAHNGLDSARYSITVTRLPSSDSRLSALAVTRSGQPACELAPAFDPEVYEYDCVLSSSITEVDLTYTLSFNDATALDGGSDFLLPGRNLMQVIVTAADGVSTSEYNINTIVEDGNAYLSELSFTGCQFTEAFDGYTRFYYCDAVLGLSRFSQTDSRLSYRTSSTLATVSVTAPLVRDGLNQVTLLVTASNRVTTRVYAVFFMNTFDEIDDCISDIPPCPGQCRDSLWTYECLS